MKVIPLSANPTKWLNTLKQFVGKLSTNYLSVSDHFLGLALIGLLQTFLKQILLYLYTGSMPRLNFTPVEGLL